MSEITRDYIEENSILFWLRGDAATAARDLFAEKETDFAAYKKDGSLSRRITELSLISGARWFGQDLYTMPALMQLTFKDTDKEYFALYPSDPKSSYADPGEIALGVPGAVPLARDKKIELLPKIAAHADIIQAPGVMGIMNEDIRRMFVTDAGNPIPRADYETPQSPNEPQF